MPTAHIPSQSSKNTDSFNMDSNSTNAPPDIVAMLPPELQTQEPLYNQTAQPKIRAVLAVCTIIAYMALGLRLYARRITKQAFGLDDLFAGLAVVWTSEACQLVRSWD